MDDQFKQDFQSKWEKYFTGAELPIAYYYSDAITAEERADSQEEKHCVIAAFQRIRQGHTFVYEADSPGCFGFKRYTGFSQVLKPQPEYWMSCGIAGELGGQRYKKSPDLVGRYLECHPAFKAGGRFLVFKRWDQLGVDNQPCMVIFFVTADILSGLVALANYDRPDPDGVVSQMGTGCATIVNYPYWEAQADQPRCVLGMFSLSSRPEVPADALTFTIPMARFEQMVANMDESFLITKAWGHVRARIQHAGALKFDDSPPAGQCCS